MDDKIVPIGPHVVFPNPAATVAREVPEFVFERIEAQRDRIFAAMAIINLAEHASPGDVPVGEPLIRFALREAYAILNAAAGQLETAVISEAPHG